MVSDRELEVWQDGECLYIESHFSDDPMFTIEQEKVLHEIAKSFLMVNRQSARRKRHAEKKKNESMAKMVGAES